MRKIVSLFGFVENSYLSGKAPSHHSKVPRKPAKSKSEALWTQSRVVPTPAVMTTRSGQHHV